MKNCKVLILDIDGTLTNDEKKITPAVKKALIELQEKGHVVVLASGRPAPGMKYCVEELEMERFGGYILSFNGGRIINCQTGEVVYQKILPREILPKLYDFAKKNDAGLITYLDEKIILGTRMDKYVGFESTLNGMEMKKVDNFLEFVDFDVNKCLMTADPELAAKYEIELQQEFADTISIYRSEPYFIELMPKNVDKATSIEHMISLLNLDYNNTIAVGDGFNDLTMIQYAKIGVAMANGQDAVKAVANYVTTKTNNEDGLLEVIHEFIN